MKERPILFSGPMVRAIMEGRKTMTRRIVKPIIANCLEDGWGGEQQIYWTRDDEPIEATRLCPYGASDDRLWIKEAWRTYENFNEFSPKEIEKMAKNIGYENAWAPIQYEADQTRINWLDRQYGPGRYRHAQFMPKWASRILLEITNVKVERLQDITEEDAASEGVAPLFSQKQIHEPHYRMELDLDPMPFKNYTWHGMGGSDEFSGYSSCATAKESFQSLWYSIHGPDSWEQNPWVWVIEFKKL